MTDDPTQAATAEEAAAFEKAARNTMIQTHLENASSYDLSASVADSAGDAKSARMWRTLAASSRAQANRLRGMG